MKIGLTILLSALLWGPVDSGGDPMVSGGDPIATGGGPIVADGDPMVSCGNPTVSDGRLTGGAVSAERDLCWWEEPAANGMKLRSDLVTQFGASSEVANDFRLDTDGRITRAIAIGGYWCWSQGDELFHDFNLFIYEDEQGTPGDLLLELLEIQMEESLLGYDGYGPNYRYEAPIDFSVTAGTTYWFVIQAVHGTVEPCWGRYQAMTVSLHESMFRSAYFGWPDWTEASNVVGSPFDAVQGFECETPVPRRSTSWGKIKAIYR